MKICLAQTESQPHALAQNRADHLAWVAQAQAYQADLVLFPELSLTNYEPSLAAAQAITDLEDPLLMPFQKAADEGELAIAVGLPLHAAAGVQIGLVVFLPHRPPIAYAKQWLHEDEQPYFVAGTAPLVLPFRGETIAFGICYETLQEAHHEQAQQLGATLYLASVAKPQGGLDKAYSFLPQAAMRYQMPVLMVNSVGPCDNFLSVGQSAVWNKQGDQLAQLDAHQAAALLWDSRTGATSALPFPAQKHFKINK